MLGRRDASATGRRPAHRQSGGFSARQGRYDPVSHPGTGFSKAQDKIDSLSLSYFDPIQLKARAAPAVIKMVKTITNNETKDSECFIEREINPK